ncbi:MAG: response regulator [Deltaproteobacteria bacterium]|nr:response regulator [Deltaproteobacteria bacterium]
MEKKLLKKILYVDDDDDIRTVGEMALSLGDFLIKVCSSGKEALAVVKDFEPDLIILDMMMPEMDGMETLSFLKKDKETEKIPVIFMTAKVQKEEVEEFKKSGAIAVITKPFDPMSLAQEVKKKWEDYL